MGSLLDADLVRGLSQPSAYPHPVDEVTTLQTHISRIFFAGDFVYKVKSPSTPVTSTSGLSSKDAISAGKRSG